MLRLIGHGIVSEKNHGEGGLPQGVSFRRRNKTPRAATRPLQFPAQFPPFLHESQIQTFDISDSPGPQFQTLLGTALQFVIQNDRFGDFLHGFAHLLALPLQGAVGFFLADFHFALQNALGPLHQFSRFQLPG
jgi:hypothetical protein